MKAFEDLGEKLLIDTFRELLAYAERKTCLHEETHRGGTLWTICDSCGMKWADDEGGVPPSALQYPDVIVRAQDILDKLNSISEQTKQKDEDQVSIVIPDTYYTGVV